MSISSSLQQVAGGIAAVLSGMIVLEGTDGELLHFDRVGYIVMTMTLVSLALMYFVHKQVPEPALRQ